MTFLTKDLEEIGRALGALHGPVAVSGSKLDRELLATARNLWIHIISKVDYNGPVKMILYCPACGTQHIDEPRGAWTNPPHRTHLCDDCGLLWRPADVPTTGVRDIMTRGNGDHPLQEPHKSGRLDFDTLHQIYHKLLREDMPEAARFVESFKKEARRSGWIIPNKLPASKSSLDS